MLQSFKDAAADDRRARILDAARRCFVREGFHRATMQDVAREAGMSPGNLYRYFPSKDAIVAGLAERDRAEMAQDFAAFEHCDDFMALFAELGRKHFQDEPRERAMLCLQIWAEATRNPAFAALSADFERDIVARLTAVLEEARRRGAIAGTVDAQAVATLLCTLADGLFVRRAILPDLDAGREVRNLMTVIEALLDGRVDLGPNRPAEVA